MGGEVDNRTDLFALGAVLYECLVGEPPPPPTPSGVLRTGETPALPLARRMDSGTQLAAKLIPPTWRTIIDKAMSPVPADRYADARAFAQALRAAREEIAGAKVSS
jgi:serine/threonine-protein kinase